MHDMVVDLNARIALGSMATATRITITTWKRTATLTSIHLHDSTQVVNLAKGIFHKLNMDDGH